MSARTRAIKVLQEVLNDLDTLGIEVNTLFDGALNDQVCVITNRVLDAIDILENFLKPGEPK